MATAELERFAAVGGRTIVEVSCLGIGRDVRALAHVARRSSVNLVAGSGYYVRSSHPYGLGERDESAIADEMIHELAIEVPGTGIRTDVLGELAADVFPIDTVERTVLRAAARAQATTGAAIVVHPGPGTESAFEVLAVLEEAGTLLDKVVIAHLDDRFGDDLGLFRRHSP